MVTITDMAEQKIKELMAEEKDTVGLRIYVRGGGCGWCHAGLRIAENPDPSRRRDRCGRKHAERHLLPAG